MSVDQLILHTFGVGSTRPGNVEKLSSSLGGKPNDDSKSAVAYLITLYFTYVSCGHIKESKIERVCRAPHRISEGSLVTKAGKLRPSEGHYYYQT